MKGLMQNQPLLLSSLLKHADRFHAGTEIVSRTVEGPIHRYGYADALKRAKQAAKALLDLGVKPGDRVATLAWSTFRHFELYYAVAGIGAILHTINPRLSDDQIVWVANHAEDAFLFFDGAADVCDVVANRMIVEEVDSAFAHASSETAPTVFDALPSG